MTETLNRWDIVKAMHDVAKQYEPATSDYLIQRFADRIQHELGKHVSQREIPVISEESLRVLLVNTLLDIHLGNKDANSLVACLRPYLRAPERGNRLTKEQWADVILKDFQTENNRTKVDEWEAAYAHLFKQLNEVCGPKRKVCSTCGKAREVHTACSNSFHLLGWEVV